jgi:ferrous iron transport protein A
MFPRKRVDQRDGARAGGRRSLADLPLGELVEIQSIEGNDAIAARLLEMGLTPGSVTQVLGTAFSGDPIEIEIRNYRLTLRRTEASRVIVESAQGVAT